MNCNVVEVHFTISWEYCISPIFSKIKDLRNHPKVLKIGADGGVGFGQGARPLRGAIGALDLA